MAFPRTRGAARYKLGELLRDRWPFHARGEQLAPTPRGQSELTAFPRTRGATKQILRSAQDNRVPLSHGERVEAGRGWGGAGCCGLPATGLTDGVFLFKIAVPLKLIR